MNLTYNNAIRRGFFVFFYQGEKIQATIKKILIPNFEMLLQEGSIIILSKFGIAQTIISIQ